MNNYCDIVHDKLRLQNVCNVQAKCLVCNVSELTTPENTITYYNALCLSPQKFA